MLLFKVTSVELAEEIKYVHDYLHITGPAGVRVCVEFKKNNFSVFFFGTHTHTHRYTKTCTHTVK